jgi:glycosyltransferase involved in cell wall biosynthesis
MNILLLSPYPPYPPYGGGTMRVYQIIRGLAARHRVTCLTFAPDEAAERALAPLRDTCRVITVRGPEPRSAQRRAWTTLSSPLPDMALRNASRPYAEALHRLLAAERFDVVQAESIEMAPYIADCRLQIADYPGQSGRSTTSQAPLLILDQFNAEYVLQKRAALTALATLAKPQSTIYNLQSAIKSAAGAAYSLAQWLKLAAYERRVMAAADAVVAVSQEDVAAMRRVAPGARYTVAPNGVDTAHFSRAELGREGVAPFSYGGPTLVFSGTLDFRPNVDALVWFAREVLPLVRARRPDARLVAVGRRPAPVLHHLAEQGALTLSGEVADARPFIAGAAAYVVPMRIGGGVRLKLLEALALEVPTVSTTMGAEGVVGLRPGEHCLLADVPNAFASAVLQLLEDQAFGARLGASGRALVAASYDWSVIVPRLEELYQNLYPQ